MSCSSRFPRSPAFVLALSLSLFAVGSAWAPAPVVSDVRASQRAGTGLVDIFYDVADADGDRLGISAQVSTDGGATYTSSARTKWSS